MRAVRGYEGVYSVTEDGQIYSHKRPTTAGGYLKRQIGSDGYYAVTLSRLGSVKRHKVHHLVAEAFMGTMPDGLVTDHIDNDRLNNHADNLRYVTQRQNSVAGQRCALNNSKTSKYAGVFCYGGKWSAVKGYGPIQYNLGVFKTEYEAHLAYEMATEESCIEQRKERKARQSSQHVGVTYDKSRKKWAAKRGSKFIGRFKTEQEAADAISKL